MNWNYLTACDIWLQWIMWLKYGMQYLLVNWDLGLAGLEKPTKSQELENVTKFQTFLEQFGASKITRMPSILILLSSKGKIHSGGKVYISQNRSH